MQTHADVKRPPELDTPDQRGVPEIDPLVEYLDVATVLKISQAVSGEISLEKLVEVVLRTAIEQAGAERALLIFPRGSELWIQAEAKTRGDSVTVRLNEAPVSTAELPESIVRYVARTQEIVILDDASSRNPYSTDEYIREQRLRSVCCLPLAKQNTLVALLYLENNIGPNIFAPAKITVLKVLASVAAISLDNSRLYHELQEREAQIRRLVDANVIGILISNSNSEIIEANDAFLKMVGYSREELVSGRMRWRDMTPIEWKDSSEQGVVQVKTKGFCNAFEKEYYRKDGSRVPVLVGAALFEKNSSIVAFAIDLTERKHAEEALRRSEFYLAEGQRLAHMGSWVFNTAGFDYWSSELFRIHGLDPSGKPPTIEEYLSLVHPEDRESVVATIQKFFAEGRGFDFTKRIVRPDGEIRRVRCVGVPSPHGGTSQGFVGTGIDVTEQEDLIQELRRREAYLAEAQRLSHTGSYGWKYGVPIELVWSEETYRICGFDFSVKPTHELVRSRVHPDDLEMWDAALAQAKEGNEVDFENRVVMPDGTVKFVQSVAYGIQKDGKFVELVGTVMDITERKRAEETLRRSEAYLAEAQRLSHTGSFGWKPDTGEIIWSAETYRIFEYDLAVTPTIGLVAQRVHPEDRASFQSVIEHVSRGASDFEHAYRLLMPDGRIKHIHALAHATQDASGNREFVGAVTDITDQKRAEESLRASEAYLADAQKLSGTGSWAWTPEAGITYWSEESYRVQGFDPRDGLPSTEQFFQRIHPDDQPGMMELMQRLSREKIAIETNFRIVHPSGAVRDIHSTCRPVFNLSGDFIEFIGTMIDITERKRAEEGLRASEAKYRHLVDTTPALIHTALPNGDLDFFNRGWLEYLGLPITDLLGWRWTAAIHPEDVEELVNKWRASLESGQPLVVESRVRRADGKYRWFLHRKQPQRNEAGKIVKWYGSSIEIEERKIAEETIRRGEAYLADAQKLSRTGSWAWSPETGIKYWSEECYRVQGFDPRDGLPRWEELFQRVHPDDRSKWMERRQRVLREKIEFETDYRLVLPDGTIRDIHSTGHPVLGPSGELIEIIGTVIDITDRKRAEALLTGEKRLHEMIATGVSLKETLNALCLMIEDQRGSTLASVLLLCPDGIHLESLAGPSLPEGWTRQIASLPIGPCAGSCGTAAYRGSPVIVSNIATDPLWAVADHRASALSYGLRASWSYPIISSGGKVLGTFCLYYREPRSPGPGDLDLIELAAHLARVAIECKVAEEQLRRSEAFLAEGQRLSHAGSWGWNASTGKVMWSQEHFRILGLDPKITDPSMDIFLERVHPDDRDDVRRAFESAIRDKRDFKQEYRTVTPDWSIRHLHGVGHAVLNKANELVEFIGSTMDITERKRTEERAQSYNEAIRLALNAFVEELDVDRFLSHLMTGLTKQFQATSCELWLFDDPIGATSLHLVYQQGRMVEAKTVGLKTDKLHTTWQPYNIGRIPRIIEISDQASLLQPTHLELLKKQGVKTLVAVPLVLGEQNLGVVELRFQEATKFTRDDLDLAQALVHHATLALQLSRLARRTEQMAVTEERNRMAREIHDTLAQAFAGIVLHSEALGSSLGVSKRRSVMALSRIRKLARSGLDEARRSVQALRPKALEGSNLSEALKQAAKRTNQTGMHACHFRQRGTNRGLSMDAQNELFRIAQEALTNVGKHARAKSVWIDLTFTARQVVLTIQDDGVGFVGIKSTQSKHSYGLATMRERAQRIGAQLEIESPKEGGTSVRVCVPVAKTKKSIKAKTSS